MIVFEVETKVLDTEIFPQYAIADLNSSITIIVLFSQEKPSWWKEINTHTCIVLYSLDVTKRNPFTDLVVYCFDTDVLLLLYFNEFCSSTTFHTTNPNICLLTLPGHLSLELCTPLLGFHELTGCSQAGKFAGFTKKTYWKAFLQHLDLSVNVKFWMR